MQGKVLDHIHAISTTKVLKSQWKAKSFRNVFRSCCVKTVVAQIALDSDSTTLSLLQKTLINEVAYQNFSGEVIVDMKADDRHLNKTIKDRVYNAMNANTRIRKGVPKVKPIKEPQDFDKLGKIPSLVHAQLQADNNITSMMSKAHISCQSNQNLQLGSGLENVV